MSNRSSVSWPGFVANYILGWVRPILPQFLISRSAVFISAVAVQWLLDTHQVIRYAQFIGDEPLSSLSATWDANAYGDIANSGYDTSADPNHLHNYHFFPLYPLILRLVGTITGLSRIYGGYNLVGVFLSHLFFLVALAFLYRLTLQVWLNEQMATRTTWLLAALPWSFTFSMAYTESLFLMISLAAMYYASKTSHHPSTFSLVVTGTLVGLASMTRPQGLALLIPALWLISNAPSGLPRIERLRRGIVICVPAFILLLAFPLYVAFITGTGNMFLIIEDNRRWGPGWLNDLISLFTHPPLLSAFGWDLSVFQNLLGLLLWSSATFALPVMLYKIRARPVITHPAIGDLQLSNFRYTALWGFALYGLLYFASTISSSTFNSSWGRYMSVVFPCIWVFALWLRSQKTVMRLVLFGLIAQTILHIASVLWGLTP